MPRDLILEIGTEELPASYLLPALEQMEQLIREMLVTERIDHDGIYTYATPRRLVLKISGLADRQKAAVLEVKGPPAAKAFGPDGKPTKAAEGFAKGRGLATDHLVLRTTPQGDYVFALIDDPGRSTVEVLSELFPRLLTSLTFPKFMRWGTGSLRFGRAVRWLLALLGDQVIEFSLESLQSGRTSRGHRFLSTDQIQIDRAENYFTEMNTAYVLVDHQQRRSLIEQQVKDAAETKGGDPLWDQALLDEVNFLVEYPTAFVGFFNPEYLELPSDLLVTVMKKHQRYFPVVDKAGKLLPLFIGVRNGGPEHLNLVAHGNEKVIRARLADARFFFLEDQKTTLAEHAQKLDQVLFHGNMGSLQDKSQRVERLCCEIASRLDLCDELLPPLTRAAQLFKADLVTKMVFEFPELQGVMGREYALLSGEHACTANAIHEHYLPRFAGDSLPETIPGAVLAVADRLDTLMAVLASGHVPSSSQDPYGLRRAAQAVLQIQLDKQWHLSLKHLASTIDSPTHPHTQPPTLALFDLFQDRLAALLDSERIPYDIIRAVLGAEFDDPFDVVIRARFLTRARSQDAEGFALAAIAFTRIANILKQVEEDAPEVELFTDPEEHQLWDAFRSTIGSLDLPFTGQTEEGYRLGFKALASLRPIIDRFFDKVLVMCEDETIRRNRLRLLSQLHGICLQLADFRQVITSGSVKS